MIQGVPSNNQRSPRAEVLRILLVERRKAAGLTQAQVARGLGWQQPTVSSIESSERQIEVLEFLQLAD